MRRNPPDLVLLDLMMPDVDGWEIFRQLKASDELKGIPVVVVTAKAQGIDRVLGLQIAGVDDYITKPFGPEATGRQCRAVAVPVAGFCPEPTGGGHVRSRLALLLLILVLLASCGGAPLTFSGEEAYQQAAAQTAFGPRPTGSEAGWATGDYILERLERTGLGDRGADHRVPWCQTPQHRRAGRLGTGDHRRGAL